MSTIRRPLIVAELVKAFTITRSQGSAGIIPIDPKTSTKPAQQRRECLRVFWYRVSDGAASRRERQRFCLRAGSEDCEDIPLLKMSDTLRYIRTKVRYIGFLVNL